MYIAQNLSAEFSILILLKLFQFKKILKYLQNDAHYNLCILSK